MIIVHESLPQEARAIGRTLNQVYDIPVQLRSLSLDEVFDAVPKFRGYMISDDGFEGLVDNYFPGAALRVLTRRDIFAEDKSFDDDWIFGSSKDSLSIVSTARMKRLDNLPSSKLIISKAEYFRRLRTLALHEVGHDVVRASHHKEATWVSVKNNKSLPLGPHCTDNTCVMYEVVDVKTPPCDEGYMLLGDERKFDAGLQDHVQRLRDSWLCDLCKETMVVDDKYRKRF